jgi:hypothetical protein
MWNLQILVTTYFEQTKRHTGTGSNSDQKEMDVCRTVIKKKTCNKQQTKISFYNNILKTVYFN